MYKLQRTFRKLSTPDKFKFVFFLPIVCVATLIDKVIDLAAMVARWVVYMLRWHWRELAIVAVAVTCIVAPIMVVIHIDQTVPKFKGVTDHQAEQYVYFNCHEMTNNFIVAEDGNVRGYVRADDRNIDRLVAVIVEHDLGDGRLLIGWLMEFKNGDYQHAVDFHNYCWEKLDGEVGYAVDLKSKYK